MSSIRFIFVSALLASLLASPPDGFGDDQVEPEQRTEPDHDRHTIAPPRDYPSRWDRLARTNVCDWLTAGEIEQGLGLGTSLELRGNAARCEYVFQLPNGRSERAFSLYVEIHDQIETVREAELSMTEGFSASLFTPFDSGAADLNVYVSKKGTYLYVFPQNGTTLWRLEYLKESPEHEALYGPVTGSIPGPEGLGSQLLTLLVRTYDGRL